MSNRIVCDGIDNLTIVGGGVRFDVYAHKLDERQGETFAREAQAQLVVSPEGLVQVYNGLSRVVRELEQRGMIQRGQTNPGGVAAGTGEASGPSAGDAGAAGRPFEAPPKEG